MFTVANMISRFLTSLRLLILTSVRWRIRGSTSLIRVTFWLIPIPRPTWIMTVSRALWRMNISTIGREIASPVAIGFNSASRKVSRFFVINASRLIKAQQRSSGLRMCAGCGRHNSPKIMAPSHIRYALNPIWKLAIFTPRQSIAKALKSSGCSTRFWGQTRSAKAATSILIATTAKPQRASNLSSRWRMPAGLT